jgi:hypothetical protein
MDRQRIKEELVTFIDMLTEDQLQRLLNLVKQENWESLGNRIHARKSLRPGGDSDGCRPPAFTVRNISLGGAFIETRRTLVIGQTLNLEVSFDDAETPLVIPGKVVRANAFGFGIQFVFEDERLRRTLSERLCG